MTKIFRTLFDSFRLLVLILLLPLVLLATGPLLVLAAIFRQMPAWLVRLEPGRHNKRGRAIAFGIGIIWWGITWGLAAWGFTTFSAHSLPAVVPTTVIIQQIATNTPTPIASTTPTPVTTATVLPATPTATINFVTITPLAVTPSPSATDTTTPTPPIPLATQVLQTIHQANTLLITTIITPTTNLTTLTTVWQANALLHVTAFAQKTSRKYPAPLKITYSTIGIPVVVTGGITVSVQNREFWVFENAAGRKEVLNDYTYTLQQQNGTWIIVDYAFKNIPLSASPPSPAP